MACHHVLMFRFSILPGPFLFVSLVCFTFPGLCLVGVAKAQSSDLVVYGGTASGVITAYSAAREGLHVVLLEPRAHLGGMVTGGLSATDLGQFNRIRGYAPDFYIQAAIHYGLH